MATDEAEAGRGYFSSRRQYGILKKKDLRTEPNLVVLEDSNTVSL